MERPARDLRHRGGRAIIDAVDAARRLQALGHERPTILAVHPVTQNPFAALLYKRTWQRGIATLPLPLIDTLAELIPLPGLGIRTALHLHWTTRVLAGVDSEEAGRAAIDQFLARLDPFLEAGGRLAWTVHNVLPHDASWLRLEADLQQAIVDRAAVIHVMAAGTAAAAAEWFSIPPERTLHVPMPSYRNVYEDVVSREESRHRLGLEPDEVVYGVVGAIKPYKGLEALVDAFHALTETDRRPRRLLIGGAPDSAQSTSAFVERCALDPRIVIYPRRIPADEMQLFLRASDIAVLPYEHSLNSGVLLLAMTFGLPVVAPASGGMGETVDRSVARTFDPTIAGSLVNALRSSDQLIEPGVLAATREAALAVAAAHDPDLISDAFSTGLLERLG